MTRTTDSPRDAFPLNGTFFLQSKGQEVAVPTYPGGTGNGPLFRSDVTAQCLLTRISAPTDPGANIKKM